MLGHRGSHYSRKADLDAHVHCSEWPALCLARQIMLRQYKGDICSMYIYIYTVYIYIYSIYIYIYSVYIYIYICN